MPESESRDPVVVESPRFATILKLPISLVYRINEYDTIRIVDTLINTIHDTYRDTYRILKLLNTNIADTVKLKSHMFHANNILI